MTDGGSKAPGLRGDAKVLHDVLLEAVRISPESFLMTLKDVDMRNWVAEIRSSTWVVAQRDGKVVGVVVAKRPDPLKDKEEARTSRYIESVWIAPELRGLRRGERLIKYLLAAEHRKNRHIGQFLLWVFEANTSAIALYERIGFEPTLEKNVGTRTEVKYRLAFNHEVSAAIHLAVNDAACREDERQYGVTYRVLDGKDSM
jgi:ribosomal protein S18 acetylase RimI-like enzyme